MYETLCEQNNYRDSTTKNIKKWLVRELIYKVMWKIINVGKTEKVRKIQKGICLPF